MDDSIHLHACDSTPASNRSAVTRVGEPGTTVQDEASTIVREPERATDDRDPDAFSSWDGRSRDETPSWPRHQGDPDRLASGSTGPDDRLEATRTIDLATEANPAQPAVRGVGFLVPPGYEILGLLGRGGMGVVYRARQAGLDRLVALKMIRNGADASPSQLERFRIEAEAVAQLRHPNVVQIHEVGEVEGRPYFSLELLEGGTLAQRIAGVPQPARESAKLVALLARAVQSAHEAGIVHRDLKPLNVLFDRDGTPKVTDFGLAKRIDVEAGPTVSLEVVGTPEYMAPEQALGQTRDVGPAADLYALGAILYTMLTGRPPLKGTSWHETIRMVAEQEPVPPSRLQPGVPRDLETICAKCLAKSPDRRYASASALAEDLDRFLEGRTVLARRTPAWERGAKWARRHPTTTALAALTLIAAIGVAAAIIRSNELERARMVREEARITSMRREAEAELLGGRSELAVGDLAGARVTLERLLASIRDKPRLDDLRAQASASLAAVGLGLERRARAESDRDRLRRFRGLVDEALLQDTMAASLSRAGRPDPTRALARAALELYGGLGVVPGPSTLSEAERAGIASDLDMLHLVLAGALARPGPGEDPAAQAREALAVLDRTSELRQPGRAHRARRAALLEQAGDAAGAALEREHADRLDPVDAFDHFLAGLERQAAGNLPAALRHFNRALQERPDLFWARCLSARALLNSRPSRPAEARIALSACLQQHPDYAWLRLLTGSASAQIGAIALDLAGRQPARADGLRVEAEADFDAAEADFRQAEAMGLDGDFRRALHMNRGVARFQRGKYADAVADFERALSLDPSRPDALQSLAKALDRLGRAAEALGRLDEAVRLRPDDPSLRRDRALLRLGGKSPTGDDFAAVLADLVDAARLDPPSSRELAEDHAHRARLLLRLGRTEDALAAADASLAALPDLAEAHRLRVSALLELRRFGEVIGSCDAALTEGPPSADLHELRGLARVARGEFAASIADFTRALALRPGWNRVLGERGRAYLMADAPALALADFEELLRLDPSSADGYAGRGEARARLRLHREAVGDAEEALRRGDPTPSRIYVAARTYAQALAVVEAEVPRRGRPALQEAQRYERRALALLALAVDHAGTERRDRFWKDIVESDAAMAAIRRKFRPAGITAGERRPSP